MTDGRRLPAVGDIVRDTALDRFGVVLGHEGPHLRLFPVNGGRYWDADPAAVRTVSPEEFLLAHLRAVNARSRQRLCAAPSYTPPDLTEIRPGPSA
ncbi:hypothetical protein [Streptomyces sp. NPDC048340]|uniref:hypothetical protein n=1 Tax=Streptomyces sp. NPDC048340 TaxID=3365537 RepID=UPI00371E90D8